MKNIIKKNKHNTKEIYKPIREKQGEKLKELKKKFPLATEEIKRNERRIKKIQWDKKNKEHIREYGRDYQRKKYNIPQERWRVK